MKPTKAEDESARLATVRGMLDIRCLERRARAAEQPNAELIKRLRESRQRMRTNLHAIKQRLSE